jgi:hypothetical protein
MSLTTQTKSQNKIHIFQAGTWEKGNQKIKKIIGK